MENLPHFVNDLVLILITAGVVTIVFKWLKQPVVLGYIVAGFLAGPNFVFFPSIGDAENIEAWGEIGVIFLLFALGLEFSFKKLASVGSTAFIAVFIDMGAMISLGYLVGGLLGWTSMDSVFLGAMMSMASTTIIFKAFGEMGLEKKKFAHIVFGMLVMEDLVAILMMVLLSTFAVSRDFEGADLLYSVLKLLFFILIWFITGIYLLPTMLKKCSRYLNNETLLVVVTGLCLGMVLFAVSVGFSAALGAFVMGSILAETVEGKRIEHLIEPVKNLFGAVFFVTVGMKLDLGIVAEYAGAIVLLILVVLAGQIVFATLGVSASGQSLKVAVQSGFSLAQIGEFSFIIASLGISLGVIDKFIYPVIVVVSVATTFTTPYCIKASAPAYALLEKIVPGSWERLLKGYAASGYSTTVNSQSDWRSQLRKVLRITVVYTAICLAIIFVSLQFVRPIVLRAIPSDWPSACGPLLIAVVTVLAIAPFMRAMMMRKNKSPEFKRLWADSRLNRTGLVALIAMRIIICVILVLSVLTPLFPYATAMLFLVSLLVVTGVIYSQTIKRQSRRIEQRFMENLHRRERLAEQTAPFNKKLETDLLAKDVRVEEVEVSQTSPSIGKTLRELNFKQVAGVNVVSIIRGSKKINIPDGNERLYPFDKLVVVGSDEEIQRCLDRVEKYRQEQEAELEAAYHVVLSQYIVEEGTCLEGKTVRELNTRENAECMIIGIDRDQASMTSFPADMRLEGGDVLWLAGEKEAVEAFGEVYEKLFAP
ncbi:MAG: cation:proton antiporter [Acidobacteriota bacterium]|jgi:CPA2 family monovalent cation:H+ antiporter-2|nr:cation:proton antiporter [Acidobacteriota bacterium]